jgi:hypothetical protein
MLQQACSRAMVIVMPPRASHKHTPHTACKPPSHLTSKQSQSISNDNRRIHCALRAHAHTQSQQYLPYT